MELIRIQIFDTDTCLLENVFQFPLGQASAYNWTLERYINLPDRLYAGIANLCIFIKQLQVSRLHWDILLIQAYGAQQD